MSLTLMTSSPLNESDDALLYLVFMPNCPSFLTLINVAELLGNVLVS